MDTQRKITYVGALVTICAILVGTFPFNVQIGFNDPHVILGPLPITSSAGVPAAFSFNVTSSSRVTLILVTPGRAGTIVNNVLLYNSSGFQRGRSTGCLIGCYAMENYAAKPNDTFTFSFGEAGNYYFVINYGLTSSIEPPSTFVVLGQMPRFLAILGVSSNQLLAAVLGISGALVAISEPSRRNRQVREV